ncbi:hypothetical protein [Cellulomonas sp. P5_C6]
MNQQPIFTKKTMRWIWFTAGLITVLVGVKADWTNVASLIENTKVDAQTGVTMATVAISALPAVLGIGGTVALWLVYDHHHGEWDYRGVIAISLVILVAAGFIGGWLSPASQLNFSAGGSFDGPGPLKIVWFVVTLMFSAYLLTYGGGVLIAAAAIGIASGCSAAWLYDRHLLAQLNPEPGPESSESG